MALRTDSQKCAHLLRRFGLGASEAEMAFYLQDGGLEGAIEKLINYDKVDEGFDLKPIDFANKKGKVQIQGLISWWTTRLLVTRRPLQEKMVLFWHNHFATSAEKVKQPGMMYVQNELFRRNATGNFQTLLMEASKDPAMVLWLDNRENVVGKPNENFAREVMELFTLGIGNYTEHDIQQSARAFTGYSYRKGQEIDGLPTADFMFRPRLHDEGEKEFFGQRGNFSGDDILTMLAAKPRTAEYIAWKMWRFFAYDKPSPALTKRLGAEFAASGLDIKTLLRAIMHSPEFYSAQAERTLYKNPCDFVIATSRALGLGDLFVQQFKTSGQMPVAQLGTIAAGMNRMGMRLFFPPDVAGWRGGADWISTGTMVERISWADILFGSGRSAKGNINVDVSGLFMQDPTPEGVTHKLVTLLDAPLPGRKMSAVAEAARKEAGVSLDERNANAVAASASRLIFASPEYQFS
jgi:uncharacterized protein (DUF1800 family)